jgi:hypothetical protein
MRLSEHSGSQTAFGTFLEYDRRGYLQAGTSFPKMGVKEDF